MRLYYQHFVMNKSNKLNVIVMQEGFLAWRNLLELQQYFMMLKLVMSPSRAGSSHSSSHSSS
jgi:hypothetical protein